MTYNTMDTRDVRPLGELASDLSAIADELRKYGQLASDHRYTEKRRSQMAEASSVAPVIRHLAHQLEGRAQVIEEGWRVPR